MRYGRDRGHRLAPPRASPAQRLFCQTLLVCGCRDVPANAQIPLVSRIVCACDAFSAMTTNRPYRQAMSHDEAIEELHRCAGTQFDPEVVEALILAAEVPRPAEILPAA
jgi:hypothetical protein